MSRQSNFLEADSSIMENNLRFVRNDVEENMNQFFGMGPGGSNGPETAPPREYKVVKPRPGLCIKTYTVGSEEKYFINVCQTEEIPAPEDISEEQLAAILESDEPSSYRIPMSISEPRTTKDKSNNPVEACDIAVNPKFFVKIEQKLLFRDFFKALIGEALNDKYNVQLNMAKAIILNNRKFIGTLVSHRVRNNDVKTVLDSFKKGPAAAPSSGGANKLVQEINPSEAAKIKQKSSELVQANSTRIKKEISQAGSTEPEYQLRVKLTSDERPEELQAEFYLPKCVSAADFFLDVGEDRILLESMKHGYLFDKFVNYQMNQDRAKAIFDKTNKMLQVRVPVNPV